MADVIGGKEAVDDDEGEAVGEGAGDFLSALEVGEGEEGLAAGICSASNNITCLFLSSLANLHFKNVKRQSIHVILSLSLSSSKYTTKKRLSLKCFRVRHRVGLLRYRAISHWAIIK